MKKQKILLIVTMVVLGVFGVALGVLYALDIMSLLLFSVFIALDIALFIANIIFLIVVLKKIKKARLAKNKELNNTTGNYLEDLYGAIGIPLQYNKDGSIKDMYDLLGIDPLYDEYGNRILTPYELLAMMPKFNEKGEEIPTVFAIKNRAGRIAKVDLTQRVLTRKLSDTEREELLIRETLQKKLDEAVQTGDKQKEQAIKKVIVTTTQKKTEKKPEKKVATPTFKAAKGSGPIKVDTLVKNNKSLGYNENMFSKLFTPKEKKAEPKKDSVPKPAPKPESKPTPKPVVKPVDKKPEPEKVVTKNHLPVSGIAIVPSGRENQKNNTKNPSNEPPKLNIRGAAIIQNNVVSKEKVEEPQPGM